MVEIKLKTSKPDQAIGVLLGALKTESMRLQYGLRLAKNRVLKFEKKYNVSSEVFIDQWTAEDLEGKDIEYTEWAGEFNLFLRLSDRLSTLQSIEYVAK